MSSQLLLGDELRSGQGGVWACVSPSRLNCWLCCPLTFRFQYVDGLRAPTTPALFLGKIVYAGLEAHYRHRHPGPHAHGRGCVPPHPGVLGTVRGRRGSAV